MFTRSAAASGGVAGGREQVRERRLGAVEQPEDVDLDHPLPLLDGRALDRPEQHHARVVDEDVEPAELVDGPLHGRLRLLALRDVGLDHERGAARVAQLRGQRVEALLAPRHERDGGAAGGELAGGGVADAAGRAGDQGDGALEAAHAQDRTAAAQQPACSAASSAARSASAPRSASGPASAVATA